jgi:HEAT repeat protein
MAVALALLGFVLGGSLPWPGTPDGVAAELAARDDGQRLRAVLSLARQEPGRARTLLLPALHDRDPGVRVTAARLLLRRGAPEAEEAATAWLGETSPRDRLLGLQVLREAAALTPAARRATEHALRDGDVATRLQALEVLVAHAAPAPAGASGSASTNASAGAILGALDDEHRDVRARAARALGQARDPRAPLPLVARLADGDRHVQSQAVAALGEIGDRRVVGALVRQLAETTPDLRVSTVEALGRLGDAAAVPALIPLLRRRPLDEVARVALGELATPEAVEALLVLAREETSDGLRVGLELAGASAAARGRVVPRLCEEVASGTSASARLAAEVLGRLGDRRATAALVSAVERSTLAAAAALGALARLADPAAVPALVHVAATAELAERRALALEALRATGDDRALVVLPHALADGDAAVRAAAVRLAGALGGAGAATAVSVSLLARLEDEDATVRREAALALHRLPGLAPTVGGTRAIVSALMRPALGDDPLEWRVLGDLLERVVTRQDAPALEKAYLSASSPRARAALARGLVAVAGAAPTPATPPVVEALLRDLGADGELACAAADALGAATLTASQGASLGVAFAHAEAVVKARLAPALAQVPGGSGQLLGELRDPAAALPVRAAAAWALASVPDARGALRAAASAPAEALAANARAALGAARGKARERSWTAVRLTTPDGNPWPARWVTMTAPGRAPVWTMTDLSGRAFVFLGGVTDGPATLRTPTP